MPSPRVRFAPSPTGYLHIGGARTALFNWLYARRHGGTFMLRIEDTDQGRSTEASLKAILEALEWLGLDHDEGPYFQSQRLGLYKEWAERLISEGKAYRCCCSKEDLDARRQVFERQKRPYKYEGTCRNRADVPEGKPHVVRFKVPDALSTVGFTDRVLGKITKETSDLDDWVMVRTDGMPLYSFACVIDDHLMEIELVVRGQEHINTSFPQLMLYRAIGWEPPELAHIPLILGTNREKLSKRLHPEADVMLHRQNGILPEALLNFIVRLGWSHGNDEVLSLDQMKEWFDFEQVGTTSGVWNSEKLSWLNQQWLKRLEPSLVAQRLVPFLEARGAPAKGDPRLEKIVLALRERSRTLVEMAELALPFFGRGVTLDPKAAQKHLTAESRPLLTALRTKLANLTALKGWQTLELDAQVKAVSEEANIGMGKVAQPLRVAITGGTISPGIGETLELIGREESLRRLDAALAKLAQPNAGA